MALLEMHISDFIFLDLGTDVTRLLDDSDRHSDLRTTDQDGKETARSMSEIIDVNMCSR